MYNGVRTLPMQKKKKGAPLLPFFFCTFLATYISSILNTERTIRKKKEKSGGLARSRVSPYPSFEYQSSTSWRSSPNPPLLNWLRDELLWERLWEGLTPGIIGGDCMVCPSGDLEAAVLLICSEYVPLHDAARDFEKEPLPVPEGVMMLSMLGCRCMPGCICIGGGGEA